MLLGCAQSPKGSKNIPDQFQWSPIGDARWRMTVIDGCNVHESISGTNTTSATNVYDEQSRLHLVSYSKDYALTSSAANLSTSYQYDYTDTGNLEKLTMTSGNATYTYTPSYDALDRVYSSAAVMTTASGSLTNTVTYDFTVGSNSNESLQVSQYTSQFGSNNVSYNYTYDPNGNITKITLSTGAEYRYVYDDIGQLIREDNSTLNRTYVYSYDDAGNILSKKTYALTAAGATPATLYSTYSYGYTDSWGDLLTSYRGVSFTYDEIGNPLTYYNGSSYTFTWENGRRLKTATVGSNTLSFTYNHDGIRTSKTVNGVVHNYTVSGALILTEEWGTNLVVYLYDANGAPIGMRYRTSSMAKGVFYTFWFDKNLQGDVVAVYNETGTKVLSYTYDAWGNKTTTVHNNSGTNSYAQYNAITYRGYYFDSETNLYYVSSRYYDAQIGRFVNADAIGLLGANGDFVSLNLFAYCGNNPVVRVDTNGKAWYYFLDVLYQTNNLVHKAYNKKLSVTGYIYSQTKGTASKYWFGCCRSSQNGCGWIATYNALIMLGNPQQPHTIISYYENSGALAYGAFGILPTAVSRYFRSKGYSVKVSTNSASFDEQAKKSTANVLFYWHSSGAHNIAVRWDGKKFVGYNVSGTKSCSESLGKSITDFLRNNGYFGAMLTSIS